MSLRLCVCTATANGEYYMSMFNKHLSSFFKTITLGSTVGDFKQDKDSKDSIILYVEGPVGHDAIKYLCDDYHLPKEQRRVLWIYSLTAGVDVYRLGELVKELQDTPFANARGCYSSVLAEHVMYSMLYFYRQTWRSLRSRAEHKWTPSSWLNCVGGRWASLATATLGRPAPNFSVPLGWR
ncbi:hypothetical protein C3747_130g86 [Trypanosoma cruzi]|uniref:Uncharacterized protein n=1 Tax=Trypanosoma cruzi TaxID=5693 RepID=A0A2V2WAF5_TRYCR|nr:hypothetical protein C3747_130g86 [Trypanosoma cruzi]